MTLKNFLLPLSSLATIACNSAQEQHPNIIYVFPDQFRNQAMAFWNEPEFAPHAGWQADPVRTPNLDNFAKESVVLYDSDLLRVERAGAVTTISDLEGGNTYTLKTVRVKRSETTSQDKATAKTIADTDTMHIQVVHDVLIVTFKDSGDTVYIKLSNKRF